MTTESQCIPAATVALDPQLATVSSSSLSVVLQKLCRTFLHTIDSLLEVRGLYPLQGSVCLIFNASLTRTGGQQHETPVQYCTMATLLNIPFEIRKLIYDECLITTEVMGPCLTKAEIGKVYVKEEAKHEEDEYEDEYGEDEYAGEEIEEVIHNSTIKNLGFGLLSTCRLLSAESKMVFYGSNTFIFSTLAKFDYGLPADDDLLQTWRTNMHYLKHVAITLGWTRDEYVDEIPTFAPWCCDFAPDASRDTTLIHWAQKLWHLRKVPLQTLSVKVEHCVCSSINCDLTHIVLRDKGLLRPWASTMSNEYDNDTTALLRKGQNPKLCAFHSKRGEVPFGSRTKVWVSCGRLGDWAVAKALGFTPTD